MAITALAPVFARKATMLGAFPVPAGELGLDSVFELPAGSFPLDCLCCGVRAAELAKPCEACGAVYDEKAVGAPKRVAA